MEGHAHTILSLTFQGSITQLHLTFPARLTAHTTTRASFPGRVLWSHRGFCRSFHMAPDAPFSHIAALPASTLLLPPPLHVLSHLSIFNFSEETWMERPLSVLNARETLALLSACLSWRLSPMVFAMANRMHEQSLHTHHRGWDCTPCPAPSRDPHKQP